MAIAFVKWFVILFAVLGQLEFLRAASIRTRRSPQDQRNVNESGGQQPIEASSYVKTIPNSSPKMFMSTSAQGNVKVEAYSYSGPSSSFSGSTSVRDFFNSPPAGLKRDDFVVSSITLNPQTGAYIIGCVDPANPDKLKQVMQIPFENSGRDVTVAAQLSCQGASQVYGLQRTGEVTINNNGNITTYQLNQ